MSLLALAACGGDPKAHADTTRDSAAGVYSGMSWRDSVAGYVVDTPPPSATQRRDSARRKDSAGAPDSVGRADSTSADTTAERISVRMAPGRPRKDSFALTYVVRKANKHPGWPVKGPAPADGALLPQKRIIAFYGNPLSK